MTEPLVTIVIPTRNYAQYIQDAVESVLNQTYRNIELIVVDDESSDNTEAIVKSFPEVKYVRIKHQGFANPANAMNSGIRCANGEYIVCLASDDTLEVGYVEQCLREFALNSKAGFVWTGRREFGDSQEIRMPNHSWSNYSEPAAAIGAMMVKKEVYQKVGLYDTGLESGEDWDMAIRIRKAGYVGVPVMKALHNCRIHGHKCGDITSLLKKHPKIKVYLFLERLFHRMLHPLGVLRNIKKRVAYHRKLLGEKIYEDNFWEAI